MIHAQNGGPDAESMSTDALLTMLDGGEVGLSLADAVSDDIVWDDTPIDVDVVVVKSEVDESDAGAVVVVDDAPVVVELALLVGVDVFVVLVVVVGGITGSKATASNVVPIRISLSCTPSLMTKKRASNEASLTLAVVSSAPSWSNSRLSISSSVDRYMRAQHESVSVDFAPQVHLNTNKPRVAMSVAPTNVPEAILMGAV